ncbi:cyclin-dependent kinase 20-like isoform X1 [Schistocerca americana]|uniref:cyclin-dependent kinase 20-like isoform X1 n=1 Tax=Schistocerca americana TaxID=7009 RepID=UPI001F4FC74E|nr:cyclin-dependent kinase 20-like isoform X1 [Schistocerca americana]
MKNYKIEGTIGQGAHGLVLRGRHVDTGEIVAVKKVLLKRIEDGIPVTIFREIKALQEVDCENVCVNLCVVDRFLYCTAALVVHLLDVFPQGLGFMLVFEFMPSGLQEMMRDFDNCLTERQIKMYMIMLLKGVAYLHKHRIMHRDLKPANLLISREGVLKIADLGLARLFGNEAIQRPYSHQVATRWYRAPELLYGARYYTESVDLWSVGCILGELLNNSPVFRGETDIEQLAIVIHTLGTPNEEVWPGVSALPDYNKVSFKECRGIPLEQVFLEVSPEGVDLLKKLLLYDASKRISAEKALVHQYFFTRPLPCPMSEMPKPTDEHRQKISSKEYDVDRDVRTFFDDLRDILQQK